MNKLSDDKKEWWTNECMVYEVKSKLLLIYDNINHIYKHILLISILTRNIQICTFINNNNIIITYLSKTFVFYSMNFGLKL